MHNLNLQNLVNKRMSEWKAKTENRRKALTGEMTSERMKRLLVIETLSMMVIGKSCIQAHDKVTFY